MKHIALTLLTLALVAFSGAILVASMDIWPAGTDRGLVTDTLLRWALALGVVGGFIGLGVLIVTAMFTPEGKR